jgi:hypothetical protein
MNLLVFKGVYLFTDERVFEDSHRGSLGGEW